MEVHVFPKGISLKVNVIARLEFELLYYDVAVQCICHDTTGTPPFSSSSTNTTNLSKLSLTDMAIRNEISVYSSILDEAVGISLIANAFEKGINPSVLHQL